MHRATGDRLFRVIEATVVDTLTILPASAAAIAGNNILASSSGPQAFTCSDASSSFVSAARIESDAYLIEEDLASGRVKPLLEQYEIPRIPTHICFVDRELMPQRVRLLINHLAQNIGNQLRLGKT